MNKKMGEEKKRERERENRKRRVKKRNLIVTNEDDNFTILNLQPSNVKEFNPNGI
jgi:hypothetical protein